MVKRFKPVQVTLGKRTLSSIQVPQEQDTRRQFDIIEAEFTRFVDHIDTEMVGIISAGLDIIMDKSLALVPRDTGELAGSAYNVVQKRKNGLQAEIGYARRGRPDYAVVVHENLEAFPVLISHKTLVVKAL